MISRFFDLIFSGSRQQKQLEAEHPVRETAVPDFGKDIPQVLKNEKATGDVIHRYQQLRDNLLERHENYEKVLKGYMRPEEALDIYKRLEEIDAALLETEQNLQRVMDEKNRPKIERPQDDENRDNRPIFRHADFIEEHKEEIADVLENAAENPSQEVLDARVEAARRRMLRGVHEV